MRRLALVAVVVTALGAGTVVFPAARGSATTAAQLPTGVITIPRIGVFARVFDGVTDAQFAHGFGHWPGTARAGERGNMVLSAHRTSGPRHLFDIDKLRKGDIINVRQGRNVHRYEVTRAFVVRPRDVWIVDPSKSSILTMFACHPKGSTAKRYVVRARLLSP